MAQVHSLEAWAREGACSPQQSLASEGADHQGNACNDGRRMLMKRKQVPTCTQKDIKRSLISWLIGASMLMKAVRKMGTKWGERSVRGGLPWLPMDSTQACQSVGQDEKLVSRHCAQVACSSIGKESQLLLILPREGVTGANDPQQILIRKESHVRSDPRAKCVCAC
eukprot:1158376-Pelagomonas_calceolata.AAC.13